MTASQVAEQLSSLLAQVKEHGSSGTRGGRNRRVRGFLRGTHPFDWMESEHPE